jgi:hypothetical protein
MPGLRAFTAVRPQGRRIALVRCTLAPAVVDCMADSVPACFRQPPILAGPAISRSALAICRMPAGPPERLSSAFFPFSVSQPSPQLFSEGGEPSNISRCSVFALAFAVLGATPVRRRLTSFAPATVDRGFDHAPPASFIGGVPLSSPHGFGLAGPGFGALHAPRQPATLMGFSDPSQL